MRHLLDEVFGGAAAVPQTKPTLQLSGLRPELGGQRLGGGSRVQEGDEGWFVGDDGGHEVGTRRGETAHDAGTG